MNSSSFREAFRAIRANASNALEGRNGEKDVDDARGAGRRATLAALACAHFGVNVSAYASVETSGRSDFDVEYVGEDARGRSGETRAVEASERVRAGEGEGEGEASSSSSQASSSQASSRLESEKKSDRKGRLKELQGLREELLEMEFELQNSASELQKSDQTVQVLQQELEVKNKLYELVKSERDRAIEEAKLASGLCAQVGGF